MTLDRAGQMTPSSPRECGAASLADFINITRSSVGQHPELFQGMAFLRLCLFQ